MPGTRPGMTWKIFVLVTKIIFSATPVSAMCSTQLNRVTRVAFLCICRRIVRHLLSTRQKMLSCMSAAHERHLASALAYENESR
jgi:hypothetical protein